MKEYKLTYRTAPAKMTRQDVWQAINLRTVSVKLPNSRYERLYAAATRRGKSVYTLVKELIDVFLMEEGFRVKVEEPLPEQQRIEE